MDAIVGNCRCVDVAVVVGDRSAFGRADTSASSTGVLLAGGFGGSHRWVVDLNVAYRLVELLMTLTFMDGISTVAVGLDFALELRGCTGPTLGVGVTRCLVLLAVLRIHLSLALCMRARSVGALAWALLQLGSRLLLVEGLGHSDVQVAVGLGEIHGPRLGTQHSLLAPAVGVCLSV